jgi:hypothetical protein
VIQVATMDASYAIARVFAGLEERGIEAVVPAKAERPPKKGTIPVRRFKPDARNRVVRCPGGKLLRPHGKPDSDGFQHFRARIPDCRACRLRAACFSPDMKRRAILLHKDHPALLRARRRYARWGERERGLYRSHRARVEGVHGEAKTRHGLARAVWRGLANMRIQAFLTAAVVNLKRLAAAILFALLATISAPSPPAGAKTMNRPASGALVTQRLRPSTTQPLLSRCAAVRRAAASLPASGSDRAKPATTPPAARPGSQRRRCASVPARSRIWAAAPLLRA